MQKFLPLAIIDETISEKEKELYLLPVRSVGLGISLSSEKICNELENSFTITALLVPLFITQDTSLPNAVGNKRRY